MDPLNVPQQLIVDTACTCVVMLVVWLLEVMQFEKAIGKTRLACQDEPRTICDNLVVRVVHIFKPILVCSRIH